MRKKKSYFQLRSPNIQQKKIEISKYRFMFTVLYRMKSNILLPCYLFIQLKQKSPKVLIFIAWK